VLNNPIRFNDPTGHVCEDPEKEGAFCFGSGTTRVGDRMVRGNHAELGAAKNLPPKDKNPAETIDLCKGQPPYKPEFTCGGIVTEPSGVTPSQIPNIVINGDEFTDYGPENPPTVNGQTFTPVYGTNQGILSGAELLLMAFEYLHYNTPFYSAVTGSYVQGLIPVLHHNASGKNVIPGVGVYNNTGMNLHVLSVSVYDTQLKIDRSPIPDGNLGAVIFDNPVVWSAGDISVKINFVVTLENGASFGNGQIYYNGPVWTTP
jgi:hypothetical protein